MFTRRLAAVTTALVAVGALAACGGDDDSPDGSGTAAPTTTVTPVTTDGSDDEDPSGTSPDSTSPASTDPSGTDPEPTTSFELTPTQPTIDGSTPPVSRPGTPIGDAPSDNLLAAVTELAERLEVGPAAILVVSEENVTWPNSAIGCPEPGMAYTDALVDGVRIVLEVDGTQYSYHSGGSRPIFYCEDPQVPST